MSSYFSHPEASGNQYAKPDTLQRQQGFGLLDTLRRDPPGQWSSNKLQQSQKFTGPVYLAIKTTMTAMGSIIPQLQRRRKHSNKTTFLQKSTVYKSVNNQNAFGNDQEYVPAESDHPVQQLIDKPNERGDTFKDVLRYLILQHRLTGVSPLWCVPNHKHKPVEIYPLPTALCQPQFQRSEEYPNGSYRLMPYYASGSMGYLPGKFGSAGAIIPAEEIRRRKDPHPFLMWDGYSPLSAGAVELDVLEAIDQCWWAVLDHGVVLDTLLLMPGQDQPAIDRLTAQVQQKHGGSRNSRRMFAMSGGDPGAKFDVKTLSPNVRDMDFPNGRATMLEFVLSLFGVPMDVAGMGDAGSYSKLYANIKKFRLLTLQPDADDWGDCFTKWTCDPWSKKPGDYRMKMVLPSMQDEEMNESQIKTDINIRSVNQRLAGRDFPPVKYGEFPEAIYLKLLEKDALPPELPPGLAPGGKAASDASQPEGVPIPDNPMGKGSRGPMVKAATTISDPDGGFLLTVAPVKKRRVLRGPKAKRVLGKMMKAIVEE